MHPSTGLSTNKLKYFSTFYLIINAKKIILLHRFIGLCICEIKKTVGILCIQRSTNKTLENVIGVNHLQTFMANKRYYNSMDRDNEMLRVSTHVIQGIPRSLLLTVIFSRINKTHLLH